MVWKWIPDLPFDDNIDSFKEWFVVILRLKHSMNMELVGMCDWQIWRCMFC